MFLKLVFICSSLEPGRDGVGDYVRRLGGELIRQGHQVAALALYDRYQIEELSGVQDADGGTLLPVFRLPAVWSDKRRFRRAKQWVGDINPEWLSLQYVPYGFQNKGLPFRLSRLLKPLGAGKRWHIMFHELWVGMDEQAPLKLVCLGQIQRQLIIGLVRILRPIIIHTQTYTYQLYLEKAGIKAYFLPLISNIPIAHSINLERKNPIFIALEQKKFNFVVFGSIHPNALIKQFTDEVYRISEQNNWIISLTIIGRRSKEHEHWMNVWQKKGLPVTVLGEQSTEQISLVLSGASVGLSSTAYAVIEKSGSVAAMLAHGLIVLCIASEWKPCGIENTKLPQGIIEYKINYLQSSLELAKQSVWKIPTASDIAYQLTSLLFQN